MDAHSVLDPSDELLRHELMETNAANEGGRVEEEDDADEGSGPAGERHDYRPPARRGGKGVDEEDLGYVISRVAASSSGVETATIRKCTRNSKTPSLDASPAYDPGGFSDGSDCWSVVVTDLMNRLQEKRYSCAVHGSIGAYQLAYLASQQTILTNPTQEDIEKAAQSVSDDLDVDDHFSVLRASLSMPKISDVHFNHRKNSWTCQVRANTNISGSFGTHTDRPYNTHGWPQPHTHQNQSHGCRVFVHSGCTRNFALRQFGFRTAWLSAVETRAKMRAERPAKGRTTMSPSPSREETIQDSPFSPSDS